MLKKRDFTAAAHPCRAGKTDVIANAIDVLRAQPMFGQRNRCFGKSSRRVANAVDVFDEVTMFFAKAMAAFAISGDPAAKLSLRPAEFITFHGLIHDLLCPSGKSSEA